MRKPIFFTAGDYKNDSRKDSYNFFLSQLRIRIEMAFGLLTSKFQILKKPLQVKVGNAGKVFLTCATLHNFIINERIATNSGNFESYELFPASGVAVGGGSNGDKEECDTLPFVASDVSISQIRGNSIMRDILVDRIANMALVRPHI
jgi:hypothetical protein